MAIKLIALDLDHTLLRDDRSINPKDIEALRAARQRGVGVTIATGRMFAAAKRYAHSLNIDVPIITYQGSLIRNLLSEEILLHLKLEKCTALRAIQLGVQQQVHVNVYIDDQLLVLEENEISRRYAEYNGVSVVVCPNLDQQLPGQPTKVVYVEYDAQKMHKLRTLVVDRFADSCNITLSLPHLLELGHKMATKARALAYLTDLMGIKPEEVLAVGDGLNDLDMLDFAGIGVAMGNAPLEVQRAADWVTADNNSAGVAMAVGRYVLL